MASRTIYEISKPTKQFYSVERAGFTDVSEAVYSAVNDMVQLGSFTVANVVYTDSQGLSTFSGWPVVERLFSLNTAGAGYKVGDVLYMVGGTRASNSDPKFTLTVNSINSTTGAITSYTISQTGKYTVIPGPAANIALEYATPTTMVTQDTMTDTVANIDGTGITIPTANSVVFTGTLGGSQAAESTWKTQYGTNGSGGTNGRRWPTAGFWVDGNLTLLVKIGTELVLLTGGGNSAVASGTTITKVQTFNRITGVTSTFNNTFGNYVTAETSTVATYFETSNPVTLNPTDVIGFRGQLATIDNAQTTIPKFWRATLETTGAVDPLSDTVGVFANVAATSSNSTLLRVNNMTTPNSYNPVIYPGQRVTSTLTNGSISGVVTVANVVATGATTANITLSSPQTLANVGEQLRFAFPGSPQNWRITFDVLPNTTRAGQPSQRLIVYAGTDIQLPNDGNVTPIYNETGSQVVDYAGLMGAAPTAGSTAATFPATDVSKGFLNRERRVQNGAGAYPLNYLLTLTNRGIFFGMWEGNWSALQKTKSSNDNFFNWFLIQRPVNRLTGQVLTTGRCPVFCINSVGYKYWKFIVREEDVLHPTAGDPTCTSQVYNETTNTIETQTTPYRAPADAHSQDNFAIINSTTQVSLTEDSKYLISLLHDLNTPRYRYSEELDMVGQTSADVCMAGNDLTMTTYGEGGARTYHAMPANNPYNSGLRIVVLKDIP